MRKKLKYLPSVICILYYLLVCLVTGRLGGTQLVWLVGAVYLALYMRLRHREQGRKLGIHIMTILLVIGLACAGIAEGVILSAMGKEPAVDADYVIVLGAKVNGTTPSLSLRYRIDSAAEYLKENPESVVVASGGQGKDEAISEALAIKHSLETKGIDPIRILLEDKSTSTEENLIFSQALIESHGGNADSDVVIVTSDFHLFRALRLAKKLGYTNVTGSAAKTMWALIPQNHLREILAVGYYFVTGTL